MLVNRPGMHEMTMPDDNQHTLTFQRVKSTDAGQLVVMANNQFGSDLGTLQLAMAGQFKDNMETPRLLSPLTIWIVCSVLFDVTGRTNLETFYICKKAIYIVLKSMDYCLKLKNKQI